MADHEMGDNDDSAPEQELPIEEQAINEIARHFAGGQRADEDYSIRRNGRLVDLRRSQDGAYQILMRGRVIQGFCAQFEDITGWRMPRDTQIQSRITIQPTGRLRGALYPEEHADRPEPEGFSTDRLEVRTTGIMPDDGIALESIAHPGPPLAEWQLEALRHLNMERSQLTHTIDMIESLGRR